MCYKNYILLDYRILYRHSNSLTAYFAKFKFNYGFPLKLLVISWLLLDKISTLEISAATFGQNFNFCVDFVRMSPKIYTIFMYNQWMLHKHASLCICGMKKTHKTCKIVHYVGQVR